jgi:WD40 repeat protein
VLLKAGFFQSAVLAFSPDGKTVLTGAERHTRLWRADTGAVLTELLNEAPVSAAAFSPDGRSFLVASRHWLTLRSWDGHSAKLLGAKWLPAWNTGPLYFESLDGTQIKLVLTDTGNSVLVKSFSFGNLDAPSMQGDVRTLLEDWERRLALTIDASGHITSPY